MEPKRKVQPSSWLKEQSTETKAIALVKNSDLNRNKIDVVKQFRVATDGSFEESFDQLEPHLYSLQFPNGKMVDFYVDGAGTTSFEGDANKPDAIKIQGSESNKKLAEYEKFRKESLERLVKSVRDKLAAMPEESGPEYERLGKLEVTNYEKHKKELVDFAKNNMSGSLATYSTISRWPADATLVEPLVISLEKAFPKSGVTERVKEKFQVIKATSVGAKAPEIKMRDGDAKTLSLYESKGKVTLIDFWGSWCGPCRREAGALTGLYSKYKDKGFQIFGVGLEEEMQLWRAAKEKDGRVWPNVLSLKAVRYRSSV